MNHSSLLVIALTSLSPPPWPCEGQYPRLRGTSRCRSCGTPSPGASWPTSCLRWGCDAVGGIPSGDLWARRRSSQMQWNWVRQRWDPWQSSWTVPCTNHASNPPFWNESDYSRYFYRKHNYNNQFYSTIQILHSLVTKSVFFILCMYLLNVLQNSLKAQIWFWSILFML